MSSGGGLMQLVAQGAQDMYLTSQPQITFFRTAYRRYTNFTMESIEQTFNGTPDFGRRVTCIISRVGDLISKMYLRVVLPALNVGPLDASGNPTTGSAQWVEYIGNALISTVELEIGGSKIDRHYGDWLQIWYELAQDGGNKPGYDKFIGNFQPSDCISQQTIYVPLMFFFNKKYGLAIPIIALQYHEVRIYIEYEQASSLYVGTPGVTGNISLADSSLFVDYIFLDVDERTRFASTSHEYLIEQLQFTGDESFTGQNGRLKLGFNHPVKELVWVAKVDYLTNNLNQRFNYTDDAFSTTSPSGGQNPIQSAKLQINGADRFSEREGMYFNYIQPYQHHTNTPRTGINVYSFSLLPEDHQPSGTCNFSRLDSVNLVLTLTPNAVAGNRTVFIKVFAVNYNVLRITSGMGGIAYSS